MKNNRDIEHGYKHNVVHNTSYIIGMNMPLLHYEVVDDDAFVLFMALQRTVCLLRLLVVVVIVP